MPAKRPSALRTPDATQFLLATLPFDRPTTFCDVGANPINEPPYLALLRAGGCRVVGFEPNPTAFAALQAEKGPLETYFPLAVGDGQMHILHLYRSSGMSSIFLPHLPGMTAIGNPGWAKMQEDVELQTVALDGIADLPPIDCLKIDIQGGEELVFSHARKTLANAVAVIVEMRWFRLYEGEPMAGGIDNELRSQGFLPHKFLFNKSAMLQNSQYDRLNRRQNLDQLIDGDVVYLRHTGKLQAYGDAQLCHVALLGSAVIDSHSLTLAALDELVRRGRIDAATPGRYVDLLPDTLRSAPPPPRAPSRLEVRQARRQRRENAGAMAVAPPEATPPAVAPAQPAAQPRPAAKAKPAAKPKTASKKALAKASTSAKRA